MMTELSYDLIVQRMDQTFTKEDDMSAKIFYRERSKVKDGSHTPRFRVVGVSGVDLKIYTKHLRRGELEQMADSVGAELITLEGGGGKRKHKHDET